MNLKAKYKNFWRHRFLLGELVKRGIKLKYRRSYLGIIWSLLEPILTTIVLTIVFGTLFKREGNDFPVYILAGRLMYGFFNTATKNSVRIINANSGMIKKVYVPKYLYPMASVLYNFVIFAISLIVLIGAMLVMRVWPTVYLAEMVVPIGLMLLFTFACSMILSTIGVFFRDAEYLWNVFSMIIMYACAIFYDPDMILNSRFWWILKFNPVYCMIESLRDAVFGRPLSTWNCLFTLVVSVVLLIIGLAFFEKKQDRFILYV